MRLGEVERGDSVRHRLLIALISRIARFRLPDAARVAFYDRGFAGPALGEWTHRAMRGPSAWTVPERELMAAAVASWNACPFCVGAHGAIAVQGIDRAVVNAVVEDYRSAPIPTRLRAALAFLETLTREPEALAAADVLVAVSEGLTVDELRDVAAVGAVFNIVTRYANALDFEIPSPADFDAAAAMLLRRGYS
jgi:uncharacterized peroxidase-related enzyme